MLPFSCILTKALSHPPSGSIQSEKRNVLKKVSRIQFVVSFPSTYPCQSVSESLVVSDLEIAITSPSFASLLHLKKYLQVSGKRWVE